MHLAEGILSVGGPILIRDDIVEYMFYFTRFLCVNQRIET